MNVAELQQLHHFPLSEAHICLEADCGHIHNSNSYCPACASTTIQPLTKWVAELVTRYAKESK